MDELKELFGAKGNLPYKLSVQSEDKIKIGNNEIPDRYPLFFGNLHAEKRKKFAIYNCTELKFVSFYPEVIEVIKKYIPEFLFVTNFGTRQSKGFGSFYIKKDDALYKNPADFKDYYSFTVDVGGPDLYSIYNNLFYSIDLFYRTLRSGINIKDRDDKKKTIFYFKSLMFQYCKSKSWTWDKKAIKEKFVDKTELYNQKKDYPNSDVLNFSGEKAYLVRDLLGLAPLQNYMWYKLEEYNNRSFSIQYDKSNEIQRFMSPILFKPLLEDKDKFRVFIVLTPVANEMFDKQFKINKVVKISKDETKPLDDMELSTPPAGSFNSNEFFDFSLSTIEEIGIDKYIDPGFQNTNEFRTIKNIYDQLISQKKVRDKNGK